MSENLQADLKSRFGPAFLGVQEVAKPLFVSVYSNARQVSLISENGNFVPLARVPGIHAKSDSLQGGED